MILIGKLSNAVLTDSESLAPTTPLRAIIYDPEPVPSTSHPNNLN
jgi:hypothetical protein